MQCLCMQQEDREIITSVPSSACMDHMSHSPGLTRTPAAAWGAGCCPKTGALSSCPRRPRRSEWPRVPSKTGRSRQQLPRVSRPSALHCLATLLPNRGQNKAHSPQIWRGGWDCSSDPPAAGNRGSFRPCPQPH